MAIFGRRWNERFRHGEREPVREAILNYGKGGRDYWLEMNIVPLHNRRGEVVYLAAIERDITEQKQQESKLSELATKDPLTKLLNRRGFAEQSQAMLSNARRERRPISLAIMDIDFFKKINDTHGHDIGDLALERLSSIIRERFRGGDLSGRLGGEEFAVLLAGSDQEAARGVMEQFRERVAGSVVELADGASLRYTVSIGIATSDPDSVNIETLTKQADRALYQAKGNGRNRVVVSED